MNDKTRNVAIVVILVALALGIYSFLVSKPSSKNSQLEDQYIFNSTAAKTPANEWPSDFAFLDIGTKTNLKVHNLQFQNNQSGYDIFYDSTLAPESLFNSYKDILEKAGSPMIVHDYSDNIGVIVANYLSYSYKINIYHDKNNKTASTTAVYIEIKRI